MRWGKACLQTLPPADHARRAARNEAAFQLCQPPSPESRVRGVVSVRMFCVRACCGLIRTRGRILRVSQSRTKVVPLESLPPLRDT